LGSGLAITAIVAYGSGAKDCQPSRESLREEFPGLRSDEEAKAARRRFQRQQDIERYHRVLDKVVEAGARRATAEAAVEKALADHCGMGLGQSGITCVAVEYACRPGFHSRAASFSRFLRAEARWCLGSREERWVGYQAWIKGRRTPEYDDRTIWGDPARWDRECNAQEARIRSGMLAAARER
jgi:hypothetical protein